MKIVIRFRGGLDQTTWREDEAWRLRMGVGLGLYDAVVSAKIKDG